MTCFLLVQVLFFLGFFTVVEALGMDTVLARLVVWDIMRLLAPKRP